jgi:hypothetical protein
MPKNFWKVVKFRKLVQLLVLGFVKFKAEKKANREAASFGLTLG